MQGQLSLTDLISEPEPLQHEKEPELKINFSCFSAFRSETGGVRYGECTYSCNDCSECEAWQAFYDKAKEYQKAGEAWGTSVALAREFFKISTVPEYSVAAYRNGIEFRDGQWQPIRKERNV